MTKTRVAVLALLGVVAVAAAGFGYRYYQSLQRTVPPGIAFGNGRIEAEEIAIATKYPARVAEILFQEGDLVKSGQVLARMDTSELEASERAAAAKVAQLTKDRDSAQSAVGQKQAQLDLAVSELKRGETLVAKDAVSRQRVEQLQAMQQTAQEALASANSQVAAAEAAIKSAQSEQERLKQQIADATLVAPKTGRILYKLGDVGETLPAGGQVATLLDLTNVYMTLFLPSTVAGRVAVGEPGRILVDAAPDRPIPGNVTFVSPQAQFTPKQVEVASERERMMFRVKVRIPPALVEQYVTKVKTGVTGVAYVRTDGNAQWPSWLESDLTAKASSEPKSVGSSEPKSAGNGEAKSTGSSEPKSGSSEPKAAGSSDAKPAGSSEQK